ncbi:MAG: N-terminal double-transrane protein [Bacteroidetes bacterium]|nr:N-terminal double-transrane protein [Bacteroidota bacterium]
MKTFRGRNFTSAKIYYLWALMSFTYPAFLFALSAIAIPIIIHLFNFRKFKTVYFSNVRFLKEVKQETQAKSKLKHLLVLAARILFITFLVLAFAQPFIPVENKKIITGDKAISIFIDNSFSMDAINKNGTLLDEAKKRAIEIVAAYKPTDRFQLLSNDFEGKHQRLVNKEEFVELLDEIKITPATRSLSAITSRAFDVLQQSGNKNKTAFILSDFQKSNTNLPQVKNDTSIRVNLIPLTATEKSNVYIDTCWFETPVRQFNQVEKLHVRIKNVSDKVIENNPIKLFINNIQKTPASFNVDKESQTEVILSFASKETGIQHCRIELNDYPVTFDDKFYFSFEVAKNIPVLCINAAAAVSTESLYLKKLFGGDSLFIFKNAVEDKLDYSTLSTNKLIILNELKTVSSGLSQELKRFMENGGSVLVFPSAQSDLNSYKEFLTAARANYFEKLDTANTKVDKINLDNEIYKDVFEKKTFSATNLDLPKVSAHYVISKATRSNEEYLLKLQNGDVFLAKYSVGKGKLYLSTAALGDDFSNFAKHAIFVPTMYKIGMYSLSAAPLFYTIGNEDAIETNNVLTGENVYHIKGINPNFDIIPEHKVLDSRTEIMVHNQITEAGNYNVYADKDLIMGISYNFNRNESDLTCFTSDQLKEQVDKNNYMNFNILNSSERSITNTLAEIDQGKKLWKLCLVLALLFLAIEIALLRLLK